MTVALRRRTAPLSQARRRIPVDRIPNHDMRHAVPTFIEPNFTDKFLVKPGARVLAGHNNQPEVWITVTTAFSHGGRGHIVTCGHGREHERWTRLFDGESRTPIADLKVNLLAQAHPVDLAVFVVSDDRVRFLRPPYFTASTDYPWVGEARVYTAKGPRITLISTVEAAPAPIQAKLGSPQPLIRCPPCAGGGDSGAPLHQIDVAGNVQLVGLHSGGDFDNSYFTPVRDAISRIVEML